MTACFCLECGFGGEQPLAQSGDENIPPQAGDFWLCSGCGLIHRFRRMVLLGETSPVLAALPAFPEELTDLPADHLQAMLARQAEIRTARGVQ